MTTRILTAIRGSFTPAFVVACLALVVALSGTAYAAVKVGAKDIKRDAVRSKHIKDGAVRSAEVRDGSLTGSDVRDGSLTGADLLDGSVTAADLGPQTISCPFVSTGISLFICAKSWESH